MTTKHSQLKALKVQADKIAATLKAAERGEKIDARFAAKIDSARSAESLKIGIVMDDKIITIDMPWTKIRDTTETGLAAWILDQMRETRRIIQ
ncbi:MAG: hypothetical protein KDJ74_12585 [Notoacmeibacter sp.]|nr:hypothetical protein [Notoacmeibacter sp.]